MAVWATLCALTLISVTAAQSNDEESADSSQFALCNSTFAEANGVGYESIHLDRTPNATWAVTLSAGSPVNTTVQTMLWYNTGGQDYSDSLNFGYDVCAIDFGLGALNNTKLRSQYDDGSRLATFDASCIKDFRQQAEEAATQLVGSTTFLSDGNLTANSIVDICDEIGGRMTSASPQTCKPYYNETKYHPAGVALTSNYNSTGFFFGSPGHPCMLKSTCNITTETFNGVFDFQAAETNATSHIQYDSVLNGVYGVYAILTVFTPVANSKREVSVFDVSSEVSCLQVTHWNPGSKIPPPRGEPIPVQMISAGSATLSKGEMAGVIVAVIVGFGLLVTALVMWWLRHIEKQAELLSDSCHTAHHTKRIHTLQWQLKRLAKMGLATS
ncbi:hypothetical protein MBLNU13_g01480t2 [Cladosporium sp. NU13]